MTCKECGKTEQGTYSPSPRPGYCFSCSFWMDRTEEDGIRIGGQHFTLGREDAPGMRGFDGRVFRIRKGDREFLTSNLWSNGRIPEHFRDRLPDNGEFIYA